MVASISFCWATNTAFFWDNLDCRLASASSNVCTPFHKVLSKLHHATASDAKDSNMVLFTSSRLILFLSSIECAGFGDDVFTVCDCCVEDSPCSIPFIF